jgi:hypothetical protein
MPSPSLTGAGTQVLDSEVVIQVLKISLEIIHLDSAENGLDPCIVAGYQQNKT